MMRLKLSILTTLALISLCDSSSAQKAEDRLRVALWQTFPNADSYFNKIREGIIFSNLVWDTLVDRDPVTNEYRPLLAKSWAWKDDKTLEFDLRDDVTFHNGDKFSADDVVYTFNFISKPEAGV